MKKIRQPKVLDFYKIFVNSKEIEILEKKFIGYPYVSEILEIQRLTHEF